MKSAKKQGGDRISYDIDYGGMTVELSALDLTRTIEALCKSLPSLFAERYMEMTPTETNILRFVDSGFEYMFDLSSELVATGVVSEEQAVEDRLVAVFGRSQPRHVKRDASRMRGFLGPSSEVFGDGYDKGHFIGHAIGGNLDVNLFPQKRDINQGRSERGKVFRKMEVYCLENPGTFCFHRPIYHDRSWRPPRMEFGLLTKEKQIWAEQFDN